MHCRRSDGASICKHNSCYTELRRRRSGGDKVEAEVERPRGTGKANEGGSHLVLQDPRGPWRSVDQCVVEQTSGRSVLGACPIFTISHTKSEVDLDMDLEKLHVRMMGSSQTLLGSSWQNSRPI